MKSNLSIWKAKVLPFLNEELPENEMQVMEELLEAHPEWLDDIEEGYTLSPEPEVFTEKTRLLREEVIGPEEVEELCIKEIEQDISNEELETLSQLSQADHGVNKLRASFAKTILPKEIFIYPGKKALLKTRVIALQWMARAAVVIVLIGLGFQVSKWVNQPQTIDTYVQSNPNEPDTNTETDVEETSSKQEIILEKEALADIQPNLITGKKELKNSEPSAKTVRFEHLTLASKNEVVMSQTPTSAPNVIPHEVALNPTIPAISNTLNQEEAGSILEDDRLSVFIKKAGKFASNVSQISHTIQNRDSLDQWHVKIGQLEFERVKGGNF